LEGTGGQKEPPVQIKKLEDKMERVRKYWNKPSRSAYVFVAPSIILLILFSVIPLIMAFGLSFFDVPITMNTAKFIGWDNFVEAFHDSRFLNSLKVTAIFTGLEVPIQVLGSLIVAALISKNNKRNKFLRAVYFLPVICSATVIGIMWRMILHSNIGFITAAMQSMGLGKINFMNTPGLTIYVVSFISIWRSFGISAIIYVTAIQQVSPSLFEAAEMDGAGKIRQFIHITVPSIRPTFWYILMTRFAGALQIFDIIYVTTNGGPNYTTESTVSYIYSRAFSSNSSMGYASAMSVVLFIIIMFITVLMYHRMNKEE
jgi:multiple sugar transport system permease protein